MRSSAARTTAAVIALSTTFAASGQAWGFVRKLSSAGIPERWGESCLPVAVYPNGYAEMTRDEIAKSIGAAARAWGPDAIACGDGSHPYLEIVVEMAADRAAAPHVAYDGRNTIAFETESWSGDDTTQVAVTYDFRQPGGRIVDTDIRINALYHSFANLDPGSALGGHSFDFFDLQNAITHELGHLIGLAHTCMLDPGEARPLDDQGNPVPACADASDEVLATTMYPSTEPGWIAQRVLSSDEVRAVCAIYPASADPKLCVLDLPDDGCGCAATGPRPGGLLAGVVGLALALAVSRARPRRAGSGPKPRRG